MSTVIDATVFLLLVSGAIATLITGTGSLPAEEGPPSSAENPAAEAARLLATNTATVNYSLSPATEPSRDGAISHPGEGSRFERTARGTLASLLAEAVVGAAVVEDARLSPASGGFERKLASSVHDHVDRPRIRTNVEAVWKPYGSAALSGQVAIGDPPPRDVDVHAATLAVDSGISPSRERAKRAALEDGYHGVARVVADVVVDGLFPPRETRFALRGDLPSDTQTIRRYRQLMKVLDAGSVEVKEGTLVESNDRLATAMARRIEADVADRYDSPEAAADAVDTETVHVTVRTWSP